MKKLLVLLILPFIFSCTSIELPSYVQDKNPYIQKFYAGFDAVLQAAAGTLETEGWKIEKQTDPSVYELTKLSDGSPSREILLLTQVKETSFFFGTRYSKVNVYVRALTERSTEVEVRYLKITSFPLKAFRSYKKDRYVKRFFDQVEAQLP
jgi:hypothetical protein